MLSLLFFCSLYSPWLLFSFPWNNIFYIPYTLTLTTTTLPPKAFFARMSEENRLIEVLFFCIYRIGP